jgi:catechol 2,3-dioxygenase-like lactoylglutathione lyase family enzyme
MLCDCHVYTTLPASDMARARQFYEKVLGFEPALVTPSGVLYDALGSRFFVYTTSMGGGNQATYMAFETDDLRKLSQELQSKGIRFENYDLPMLKTANGIADTPDGRGAWFKDTEGNTLAIFQPVQKLAWPRELASAGHRN